MNSQPYSTDVETKQKTRDAILEELGVTEKYLEENVEIIISWFETQFHLPETPGNNLIEFFLIANKLDVEVTKKRLDAYYTLRTSMPQIFECANPCTPQMKMAADSCDMIPLPKLVNNKYGVIVIKEKQNVPAELDGHWWIASLLNIYEIKMRESLFLDNIYIYDHEHLSMNHVYKITPAVLMSSLSLLEKILNDNLQELHFINNPPILQIILTLCKTLMKPELYNKFRFHDSPETLLEYIPIDVLPKDFGGAEKSLDELKELWTAKQMEFQTHFDRLDDLKVDETLRPSLTTNGFAVLFPNFSRLFLK